MYNNTMVLIIVFVEFRQHQTSSMVSLHYQSRLVQCIVAVLKARNHCVRQEWVL